MTECISSPSLDERSPLQDQQVSRGFEETIVYLSDFSAPAFKVDVEHLTVPQRMCFWCYAFVNLQRCEAKQLAFPSISDCRIFESS